MPSLVDRMMRASKLDINLYEEVEADQSSIGQAILVVVISSLAAGIGTIGYSGLNGLIFGTLASLVGWVVWVVIIYVVGAKLLPEAQTKSDISELLRTTGFAYSPGVLRILFFIPFLGALITIAAGIWILVAMIIAVRQALDYKSTWRAILVCVIGFVVYIFIGLFFVRLIVPTPDL